MKTTPQRAVLRAPFSIKSVDEGAHSFRGLASTWDEDFGSDVIHKGAFARTLSHWRSSKSRVPIPLLDHHSRWDIGDVLGKMTEAEETDDGLDTAFAMVPDDDKADAALRRLKGGFITGLSIGYEPLKFDYEDLKGEGVGSRRIRHLREVKLHEISLVVFPMNSAARVELTSVKSLAEAIRDDMLTDDDRTALAALSTDQKAALRALLDTPSAPSGDSPADTLKGLAPDAPERLALSARLRGLKRTRLALIT